MAIKITDKDLGLKKFLADMNKLKRKPHVKFGILSSQGKSKKKNSSKSKKSKLTVLDVAVYNEFGTERFGTERIPPRPFIRTTFDENKEKYFNRLKTYTAQNLGPGFNPNPILEIVGIEATSDVKNIISKTHSSWAPNAPATIKRKKSAKPLIDTGQLLGSINHQVFSGPGMQ